MKETVFITGASSGIGRETALAFARLGYSTILVARRINRLEELKKEIEKEGSQMNNEHHIFSLDVGNNESVTKFFNDNANLLCTVTILVNNAGLAIGLEKFQNMQFQDMEKVIQTNILGFTNITHQFIKIFIAQQKPAHIIHLGSIAGRTPYVGGNIYSATKAYVKMFSKSLRLDLAPYPQIRLTEIAPGRVKTEFSQVRFHQDMNRAEAVYANNVPLHAEDIAEIILWVTQRPKRVNIEELVVYPTDQA